MSELYFCRKSGLPRISKCVNCNCEEVVDAKSKAYRNKQKQLRGILQAQIDSGNASEESIQSIKEVWWELERRIKDGEVD